MEDKTDQPQEPIQEQTVPSEEEQQKEETPCPPVEIQEETPSPPVETQDDPPEVVSSSNREVPKRSAKTRRAPKHFQNYGLAYLPYRSNFEPSEDARRRADEFLKALKL